VQRLAADADRLPPYRWGALEDAITLPQATLALLRRLLGRGERLPPPLPVAAAAISEEALAGGALEALRAALGKEGVDCDPASRLAHARGMSSEDLLLARYGAAVDAPDAVLAPRSHEQVLSVLSLCAQERIAVVPSGGRTSVVGALAARRAGFSGLIALDLRAMDALLQIDEQSASATFEPGVVGAAAEAALGRRGYTLGHFPQSLARATIGGFAATRSAGQASTGYGRFDQNVLSLRIATPRGELAIGRAPRSSAGPDLRELFLGSEGALGVITAVRLGVRRAPAQERYEGYLLPDFDTGLELARELSQSGAPPMLVRVSDQLETLAGSGPLPGTEVHGGGGSLAIIGHAGDRAQVRAGAAAAAKLTQTLGGRALPGAGERWRAERYMAPHLRDALLDAGYFAETLETAAFWSDLAGPEGLYERVRSALVEALTQGGARALVMCHVSHLYPAGASLYFTAICRVEEGTLQRWQAARRAAGAAIAAVGGTISHHHGIGTYHRAALADEIGPLGVQLLRAMKSSLDPQGIMSPGVLIP